MTLYTIREISFVVAEGSRVYEVGDVIEIVHPDSSGALHVSFLERSIASLPNEDEARSLLESFARSNRLTSSDDMTITAGNDEVRGYGQFHPEKSDDDTPAIWIVGCVIWPELAIRMSYCADKLDKRTRSDVMVTVTSLSRAMLRG